MGKIAFDEKYNLVSDEFKTAREIGLAAATLGAMVRRGLVEATDTVPKMYRKSKSPLIKIYSILSENQDDYEDYFVLYKSGNNIGMLCSIKNNTIVDCWEKPYDLTDVNKIEFRTKSYNLIF